MASAFHENSFEKIPVTRNPRISIVSMTYWILPLTYNFLTDVLPAA